jgi:hypothetical protein
MSFELAHQSKNKIGDSKALTPAKPSSYYHNSLAHGYNDSIADLQRAIGNQAMQRLMSSSNAVGGFDFAKIGIIQPKLRVSQPNDPYEEEANGVADQVMRMSVSDSINSTVNPKNGKQIGRKCTACEMKKGEEEKMKISRKPSSNSTELGITVEDINEISSIRSSGGKTLDPDTGKFMESRFGGYDFSNVRIHDDERAASQADILRASAFTIGNHVVFGRSLYQPSTLSGRKLLAHELTHVIQQSPNQDLVIQRAPPDKPSETKKNLSKEDVANIVGLHLIDYREQVSKGILSFNPPEKESSSAWFMIALAGNLVWAATSFVNPAAALAIRAMSLAGSVIGTGTVEKALNNEVKAPDLKPLLLSQVSSYVDQMKTNMDPLVDGIYSYFLGSGMGDPDKNITARRQKAWEMIFDKSVAPWDNSTAIIKNTTDDVTAIWNRFKSLFDFVILSIYGYPRYKGEELNSKVQELYYIATVQSGVADRSVAVKKTNVWKEELGKWVEYKAYEFPSQQKGMTGWVVREPTGKTAIPIEVVD